MQAPRYTDIAGMDAAALQRLVDEDPAQAAQLLAAAARYGLVEAQLIYAQCLLDGRGLAADARAAFGWFGVAAQAGSVAATNMLGRCHENGWGVAKDDAIAAQHYRRAAEQGLDWAQYNWANMLARGAGVPMDRDEALLWYWRAAAQGHAKSMNLIGRFLEEGWTAAPDPRAAAQWYRRAAEAGDFRGQFNWGMALAQAGQRDQALHWFLSAAAEGSLGFLRSMARALQDLPAYQPARLQALHRAAVLGGRDDAVAYAEAAMRSGDAGHQDRARRLLPQPWWQALWRRAG